MVKVNPWVQGLPVRVEVISNLRCGAHWETWLCRPWSIRTSVAPSAILICSPFGSLEKKWVIFRQFLNYKYYMKYLYILAAKSEIGNPEIRKSEIPNPEIRNRKSGNPKSEIRKSESEIRKSGNRGNPEILNQPKNNSKNRHCFEK